MYDPIHPSVPVQLHPGVRCPPLAAGREALAALYRAYAALQDAAMRPGTPHPGRQVASALARVDGCLAELHAYEGALLVAHTRTGTELARVRTTIAQVQAGKQLLHARNTIRRRP